jgi:hypothetical protein
MKGLGARLTLLGNPKGSAANFCALKLSFKGMNVLDRE